jgi:hypothetical protein
MSSSTSSSTITMSVIEDPVRIGTMYVNLPSKLNIVPQIGKPYVPEKAKITKSKF